MAVGVCIDPLAVTLTVSFMGRARRLALVLFADRVGEVGEHGNRDCVCEMFEAAMSAFIMLDGCEGSCQEARKVRISDFEF
jgi:hypothetical protein